MFTAALSNLEADFERRLADLEQRDTLPVEGIRNLVPIREALDHLVECHRSLLVVVQLEIRVTHPEERVVRVFRGRVSL